MVYTYKLRKKIHCLKNESITFKAAVKSFVFLGGVASIILFNILHELLYMELSVAAFVVLIILSMLKGW